MTRATALGRNFALLWGSAGVSTLGDGIYLTALPLLAAQLTRDPLAIGLVASVGFLPWLLFGLFSGVLVDRWDRRQTMWLVDLARFAVVVGLAVAVAADVATIGLLLGVGFVLGVGQTLFDNASQAMIPELVERQPDRLERANSRLVGTQTVTRDFAGPPAGGLLFGLAPSLPFFLDAVSFAASSAVLLGIPRQGRPAPTTSVGNVRAELTDGIAFLRRHRLLLTLAVMGGLINIAFATGEAVLVLFAQDELGLTGFGFGLLLSAMAVGGVLGSLVSARVSRWLGPGTAIVASTVVFAAGQLGFALSPVWWTAAAILVVSGVGLTVYEVLVQSFRQAVVPDQLMGRVLAAFRLIGLGVIPLGGVLGGLVGRAAGVRAPFLVAAGIMAVVAVLALRVVTDAEVRAARGDAEAGTADPVGPGGR